MIKLSSDIFRRAVEKAKQVNPACALSFTDEINFTFTVARSGGGVSIVDIWFQGGTTWTSCDCAAGVGLHRGGNPMPCYHVAQAALSIGLLPGALPVGAALNLAPEGAASRQVPAPLINLSELAPIPTSASVPAPPAPQTAGSGFVSVCRARVARLLGRVFWFSARSARA